MVTKLSASGSEPTIQEHLQRAKELGVTVEEYCGAYSADIEAMLEEERRMARKDSSASKPTPGKLNDFVKVQVLPDAPCSEKVSSPARVCCRLQHPSGWELVCHEWPSGEWLASLPGVH